MEEKAVKEVQDAIDRFIKVVEGRNIEALGKVAAHEKESVFSGSQAGDK